jgi:AcrR family transcriptional regulator
MTAALDTTTRILDAAATLFAERGYNGTTTRAIAQRAGVNEVTIFRRFASKQGLLGALAETWAQSMAGYAVSQLPEPSDTFGTLTALAELEVDQATRFGGAALRLALDARTTPEVEQVLGGGPGGNFRGLSEYLGQRQQEGDLREDIDAEVMAEAFFALTSQLVMSRQVLDATGEIHSVPLGEAVRQTLGLFFSGVRAVGRR